MIVRKRHQNHIQQNRYRQTDDLTRDKSLAEKQTKVTKLGS